MSLFAQTVDMKNVVTLWKSSTRRVVVGKSRSGFRVLVDGQAACDSRSALEVEAYLQSLPIELTTGDELYDFAEIHLAYQGASPAF